MARIEQVDVKNGRPVLNPIDVTKLVNQTIPGFWKCPHCQKENKTGKYAESILMENFLYLEHCPRCGYVHSWELELTDDFKKKVVNYLLKESRQ